MNTRKTALTLAKIAGYHDDTRSFTRLIIESRVNRAAMNDAFMVGKQAKANGVKCTCYQCQQPILPAFKITHSDGTSHVTSMAAGTTLETAQKYFVGQKFTDEAEDGTETKWTATAVEQI